MFVERLMQIVADARRIELRAGDIVNVGRLRAFKQTSAGRAAAPDRFECARQRQIERGVEILLNGNAVHDDRLIAAALGTHDVRVGREVLKHEEAMRVRRGRLRLGRRGGTHANVRERFFRHTVGNGSRDRARGPRRCGCPGKTDEEKCDDQRPPVERSKGGHCELLLDASTRPLLVASRVEAERTTKKTNRRHPTHVRFVKDTLDAVRHFVGAAALRGSLLHVFRQSARTVALDEHRSADV